MRIQGARWAIIFSLPVLLSFTKALATNWLEGCVPTELTRVQVLTCTLIISLVSSLLSRILFF